MRQHRTPRHCRPVAQQILPAGIGRDRRFGLLQHHPRHRIDQIAPADEVTAYRGRIDAELFAQPAQAQPLQPLVVEQIERRGNQSGAAELGQRWERRDGVSFGHMDPLVAMICRVADSGHS